MSFDLGADRLGDLSRGAALLGTGGGGDPHVGRLLVEQALGHGASVRIIDPDDVPDDAFVVPVAQMGAPTVGMEKLPGGDEPLAALRAIEAYLGRAADAVVPVECGGINSMIPLLVAAKSGLPVVDADGMGRAFPELQMKTFAAYGVSGSPAALAGENGESAIIDTGSDDKRMEWLARGVTLRLGGVAHVAEFTMSGADLRRTAIKRTLSLGLRLGAALRESRATHRDPVAALADVVADTEYRHLRRLFTGKIIDVERRTENGFTVGRARFAPFDPGDTTAFELTFQNEHLVAELDGRVLCTVPDLICVLETETGEPITTEGLRYGQRATVIGIGTPPVMRTEAALAAFGPSAFRLGSEFHPVESLSSAPIRESAP